jgi:hypothetical protein
LRVDKSKDNVSLDAVLRRHLGRLSAPDELWDRVVLPRVEHRTLHRPVVWILAASALTASVFAAAWGYHPHPLSLKENPEFRSNQASDIQAWVRNRTGLDLPLRDRPNPSIQMMGASVVESSGPTIAVRYRAGGQAFVLLVSRAGSQRSSTHRHADLNIAMLQNARAVSWTMAGQSYSLASPSVDGWQAACSVCHSTSLL